MLTHQEVSPLPCYLLPRPFRSFRRNADLPQLRGDCWYSRRRSVMGCKPCIPRTEHSEEKAKKQGPDKSEPEEGTAWYSSGESPGLLPNI